MSAEESKQQEVAEAPFALTPAQAVKGTFDYTKKTGIDLWNSGVTPLLDEKERFDCTEDHFK